MDFDFVDLMLEPVCCSIVVAFSRGVPFISEYCKVSGMLILSVENVTMRIFTQ